MTDFTSALFLGNHHPADRLPSWASLTTGRPAAMGEPVAARLVAARAARDQGAEAGTVHRSALHALWDVVDHCTAPGSMVAVDAAAYPLSRWAAAGALSKRVPVVSFDHHDAAGARAVVEAAGRPPLILTDGWCPDCGGPAPLAALAALAAQRQGVLVVDDTLACGVLGSHPSPAAPFGSGGGGTPRWLGRTAAMDRSMVQVASMAKAYGAPLAVTTGPEAIVGALRGHGSRWHSSPPSAADLGAAMAATAQPADCRRRWLARLVAALRRGLRRLGLPVIGRPFPFVSVDGRGAAVLPLYRALTRNGVTALLRQPRCWAGQALTFSVTANHGPRDVARALDALASALQPAGARP